MITFKKFTGINNVVTPERLKASELSMASDVDIGLDNEVLLRKGYVQASGTLHYNVHEAVGFVLATRGPAGDLVNVTTNLVLRAGLGNSRVWYCDLPDGRVAYSNGVNNGIVSGAAASTWGVPIPAALGAAADTAGALYAGKYQYSLTYVRTADGLESGPAYSAPVTVALGGVALTGLPTLAGHTINVYLTSHYGGQGYYAGNTAGATFSFTGANKALVMPCRTDYMQPAPVGTLSAMWRGRSLVAVGAVLYASRNGQYELFDLRRDFKRFTAPITLVQPVDDGVYIGTEKELAFLQGTEFDKLVFSQVVDGAVVLGSGVAVDGELVARGDGVGSGSAMLCIANRGIVAGFNGGVVSRMSEGRYATSATVVWATIRKRDGIPQYIAAVQ